MMKSLEESDDSSDDYASMSDDEPFNGELVDDSEQAAIDSKLQRDLASGKLKPGLHSLVAVRKKIEVNNIPGMKSKLDEIK